MVNRNRAVLAAAVDGHHIGVVEPRRQSGLALETFPEARIGAARQHFQRVVAGEPGVAGQVHRAHAARSQQAFDPIPGHLAAGL